MKVTNMTSSKGNPIANQFIITNRDVEYFQSYNSIIALKERVTHRNNGNEFCSEIVIKLDENYWDYSTTTGKYRNQFLGETKKETQAKIDSGEYVLVDLNN